MKSNKNIVLIGMMGSGKSSIGKILSKKLNLTIGSVGILGLKIMQHLLS